MPLLSTTCIICEKSFESGDEICSTSCGHVYHFSCLREWLNRNNCCPICRNINPSPHQLYLTFENSEEYSDEINKMKAQLRSTAEKIDNLTAQLAERDENFLELQKQYTSLEAEKLKIQSEVSELQNYERNFLDLQKQYTEKSENLQDLQDHVQLLTIDNASFSNNDIESAGIKACDSSLINKINFLEKKLQHLTAELEKEITNSMQLSIEKMRLQCYIDRINLNDKNSNSNIQNRNPNISKSAGNARYSSSKVKESKQKTGSYEHNDIHKTSVTIKNIPADQITNPLENVVINLASKMNLSIGKEDLSKVNIVENTEQQTSQVTLFVQFKTIHLRNTFLWSKKVLRNDPTTRCIIINDCVNDQDDSLFMYAKQKLRLIGLNWVFYKNNQILAKVHRNHPKTIRIVSKSQVDTLIKERTCTLDEAASSNEFSKNCIDENYYQI